MVLCQPREAIVTSFAQKVSAYYICHRGVSSCKCRRLRHPQRLQRWMCSSPKAQGIYRLHLCHRILCLVLSHFLRRHLCAPTAGWWPWLQTLTKRQRHAHQFQCRWRPSYHRLVRARHLTCTTQAHSAPRRRVCLLPQWRGCLQVRRRRSIVSSWLRCCARQSLHITKTDGVAPRGCPRWLWLAQVIPSMVGEFELDDDRCQARFGCEKHSACNI